MSHAAVTSSIPLAPCVATLIAVAALAATRGAEADLIASWNFNGIDPALGSVVAPSLGSGSLDFGDLGAGASMLLGTTLGAPPGELAGDSLAAIGTGVNGRSIVFEVPTVGYADLALSFATRRSSTGAGANRLEYWSNLGWMPLEKFTASTVGWEVQIFSLASLMGVTEEVLRMRIVLDGATSSSGSIRFDNLTVSGSSVPAPGAIALLGVAGCVVRRRRR